MSGEYPKQLPDGSWDFGNRPMEEIVETLQRAMSPNMKRREASLEMYIHVTEGGHYSLQNWHSNNVAGGRCFGPYLVRVDLPKEVEDYLDNREIQGTIEAPQEPK